MDVAGDWAIIKKCFIIIERASLLHLNIDKSQFFRSSIPYFDAACARLRESDPAISHDRISQKIKYLGIILGHNTVQDNWAGPLKRYIDAVYSILNLDCGLTTSLSLYNMLAHSTLSYVSAFFLPNATALAVEKWGLQKILRGPWNAIPSRPVFDFKVIGLPVQARSIFDTSVSAQVRSANHPSTPIHTPPG